MEVVDGLKNYWLIIGKPKVIILHCFIIVSDLDWLECWGTFRFGFRGDSLVENASESYVFTAEALSNAHLIVFCWHWYIWQHWFWAQDDVRPADIFCFFSLPYCSSSSINQQSKGFWLKSDSEELWEWHFTLPLKLKLLLLLLEPLLLLSEQLLTERVLRLERVCLLLLLKSSQLRSGGGSHVLVEHSRIWIQTAIHWGFPVALVGQHVVPAHNYY